MEPFVYASCTLFRVGYLISTVVVQDNVLGFSDLSRERYELRERCEALLQKQIDVKKELVNRERMLMLLTLCRNM